MGHDTRTLHSGRVLCASEPVLAVHIAPGSSLIQIRDVHATYM